MEICKDFGAVFQSLGPYRDTAFAAIETGAGSFDAYFETILGITPSHPVVNVLETDASILPEQGLGCFDVAPTLTTLPCTRCLALPVVSFAVSSRVQPIGDPLPITRTAFPLPAIFISNAPEQLKRRAGIEPRRILAQMLAQQLAA